MKAKSFSGMRCSVAGALEMIGDRWTLLLLRDLGLGLARFEEFQSSTGIANTTLSTRLKELERHGVVERIRYRERPPRDEYRLTEKGRDLWKVITALREWGDRWDASGYGAPTIEVVDRDTERELRLALVDPQTGQSVPRERVTYRPGPGADEAVHALLQRASARPAS
ncbi:MAG: helix-turn-helix transcriptional regulator [Phenylobacterium sp.]|uniref:winged helix-turn-helix transcriptional regulator n=1 Tax=Phenylobacterium sp. TaxID=1871053 RepID=UPI001B565F86|nr:helix-turn-helix domain-containing protein [Phenylobacterium sp.]MBP7815925.1 helix-turn-helix transcriptional regulator [Phenylobacterium sp.]MBP9230125.1 helix-turn-helix transcriptional regulator [Phenylobacterium sp.]